MEQTPVDFVQSVEFVDPVGLVYCRLQTVHCRLQVVDGVCTEVGWCGLCGSTLCTLCTSPNANE